MRHWAPVRPEPNCEKWNSTAMSGIKSTRNQRKQKPMPADIWKCSAAPRARKHPRCLMDSINLQSTDKSKKVKQVQLQAGRRRCSSVPGWEMFRWGLTRVGSPWRWSWGEGEGERELRDPQERETQLWPSASLQPLPAHTHTLKYIDELACILLPTYTDTNTNTRRDAS